MKQWAIGFNRSSRMELHFTWWGTHYAASTILNLSPRRSSLKAGDSTVYGENTKSPAERHPLLRI
jgi:hypothetical protein